MGELNAAEQPNWVARAVWQLHLPTGQLVVSGIVDSAIADVPALAEADLDDLRLCSVDVPPGNYTVTVYAYLPDLTGEWINIISGKSAHPQSDLEPENPLAYFRRTRPEAPIPAWLGMNFAETKAESSLGQHGYWFGFGIVTHLSITIVRVIAISDPNRSICYISCSVCYIGCSIYCFGCSVCYIGCSICCFGCSVCYIGCSICCFGCSVCYISRSVCYIGCSICCFGCSVCYVSRSVC